MCGLASRAGSQAQSAPRPELIDRRSSSGGQNVRAYQRVARFGAGWIAGSRGVETFRQGADGVAQAWAHHGCEGEPWLMALPYFALGSAARESVVRFLTDHYAVEGATAVSIAEHALTDARALNHAIGAYEAAGCHELMLLPCSPDPEQVALLARAVR